MSIVATTFFLFTLMLVLLALGLPIAFALGGAAAMFGLILMGARSFLLIVIAQLNSIRTIVLIALPLFIFMGNILQVSNIAEDAYAMAQKWIGGIRGGLAIATVFICTMFAACTGISGAATVTMGLIALPAMLRRKYNKYLAVGCIMAGGALGVLIPPSAMMILYGFIAPESVGRLFAGGIIPGLILSGLFVTYISLLCALRPDFGPSVPQEERASLAEKLVSLRSVILPILLIAAVLGSIFSGFATPTEAAAVGCFGALICSAVNRQFNRATMTDAVRKTISLTAMVMWIVIGATAFTTVFTVAGGSDLVKGALLGLNVPPLVVVLMMQLTFFILGMFMDPTGIILLCTPIYVPVIKEFGYSAVWFGVLFVVNMEMAYLTPPYGMNLFYMKGIVPRDITMLDLYKAAIPFIIIQALALVMVLLIPQLVTWLPNLIFGPEL